MDVYKKREFCKAIKCIHQVNLDVINNNASNEPRDYLGDKSVKEKLIENTENYCHQTCFAWKFHDWLQKNGYVIVKEKEIDTLKECVLRVKFEIYSLESLLEIYSLGKENLEEISDYIDIMENIVEDNT